jgi:hypothetical protein
MRPFGGPFSRVVTRWQGLTIFRSTNQGLGDKAESALNLSCGWSHPRIQVDFATY